MQLMLKVLSVKSRSIYVCNAAPVFFFCDLFNVLKNSMSYLKMLPGKAWVAWLNLGRLHEFILYNIVYHSNVWLFAHSVLSSLRLWCLEIPGNGKFKQGYQISPQEKTRVCLQCKSNLTFEHQQSLWNHGRSDWTASEWCGMAEIDGPVS